MGKLSRAESGKSNEWKPKLILEVISATDSDAQYAQYALQRAYSVLQQAQRARDVVLSWPETSEMHRIKKASVLLTIQRENIMILRDIERLQSILRSRRTWNLCEFKCVVMRKIRNKSLWNWESNVFVYLCFDW